MSAHHGNTPAAWTAVVVGLLGFTVGGVGLMFDPVSYPVFWVGVAITVAAVVVFVVMDRLGWATTRPAAGDRRERRLRAARAARHPRAPDARAGGHHRRALAATLALHVRDPHQHGSWGFCPQRGDWASTARAAAACARSTT